MAEPELWDHVEGILEYADDEGIGIWLAKDWEVAKRMFVFELGHSMVLWAAVTCFNLYSFHVSLKFVPVLRIAQNGSLKTTVNSLVMVDTVSGGSF